MKPVSMFDSVRIRSTPLTVERGLANLEGQVYGETTPSVTDVEVIGEVRDDYAINVHFDGRDEDLWFADDLVEFVDHAAGTEIRYECVPGKWIRSSDGQWVEEPAPSEPLTRPWWKFW